MNGNGLNDASEDSFPASDPPSLTIPAPAEQEGNAGTSSESAGENLDDGEAGGSAAQPN